MNFQTHHINGIAIAEVTSDGILIASAQDGLDLLGNLYYQGFDRVIIHESGIAPEFFDLKTKMAGEILQKFSNYRVRLAIVGTFDYPGKSLRDFILESNQNRQVNFVPDLAQALQKLAN